MNRLTYLSALGICLFSQLHAAPDSPAEPRCSISMGARQPLGYEVTVTGSPNATENGSKILVGFRDGKIALRDVKSTQVALMSQSDFPTPDLVKIREAIVPLQESVKSLGCQVDRFSNGNRKKPLWFNQKGGMKRPGDLGVNGLPPVSSNLRIRGVSTTYSYEIPARIFIIWQGAKAAPANNETPQDPNDFQAGTGERGTSGIRCRRHFAVEVYDTTIGSTPCDLYSMPVYRCGIEDDRCGYTFNKYMVVIKNRKGGSILYNLGAKDKTLGAISRLESDFQSSRDAARRYRRETDKEEPASGLVQLKELSSYLENGLERVELGESLDK